MASLLSSIAVAEQQPRLEQRTWTDTQGRTLLAVLVAIGRDGREIKLRRDGSATDVTVSLDRLSEADQRYVEEVARARTARPGAEVVEMSEFIKAMGENRTDALRGCVVSGGGVVLAVENVKKGVDSTATVIVGAKRPSGEYVVTVPNLQGQLNHDSTDQLLMVALTLRWPDMPPAVAESSGGLETAMLVAEHVKNVAMRFRARFEGKYVESGVATGSAAPKTVRLPVLVVEGSEGTK